MRRSSAGPGEPSAASCRAEHDDDDVDSPASISRMRDKLGDGRTRAPAVRRRGAGRSAMRASSTLEGRFAQIHVDAARNAADDFNPFHDPHHWQRIVANPFPGPLVLGFQPEAPDRASVADPSGP